MGNDSSKTDYSPGTPVTLDEKAPYRRDSSSGHPEVELLRGNKELEAAESSYRWKNCHKNPGHKKFISAQDYKCLELPKVKDVRSRGLFRSSIDLTVRLKVNCTSTERPISDGLSQIRGTKLRRWGTGFIDRVYPSEINKPCPCGNCGGLIQKKHWIFVVHTAYHVVYNTEEAAETKADLFLDDESCERDGRMKTVWGVKVLRCFPHRDVCYMECVTCDEDVGGRMASVVCNYDADVRRREDVDLSGLDLPLPCDGSNVIGLIVSHPHGQPKKITWGQSRGKDEDGQEVYTAPTCPGSSGAPVFRFRYSRGWFWDRLCLFYRSVHSGSYNETSTEDEDQLNCGFWTTKIDLGLPKSSTGSSFPSRRDV